MYITISTFNIQNKYKIKRYSGIDRYGDHAMELVNFIEDENIDIIGIQELTPLYQKRLENNLPEKYQMSGKYRYTSIGKFIPFISKYNESNKIITRFSIEETSTRHLPFFPNIPRIVTKTKIRCKDKVITVYNTHLDFISPVIRKKQLDKLFFLISQDCENVILMGDFNSFDDQKYFKDFIEKLNNIGIVHIEIDTKTHYRIKKAIDHIFVSNKFKIVDKKVLNLGTNMSDHMPIVVKIDI